LNLTATQIELNVSR